jgi:hypothetical protein
VRIRNDVSRRPSVATQGNLRKDDSFSHVRRRA